MKRTLDESRSLLRVRAKLIRDQRHFDAVMEIFPAEMRDEVYAEIAPLLTKPFVFPPPAVPAS